MLRSRELALIASDLESLDDIRPPLRSYGARLQVINLHGNLLSDVDSEEWKHVQNLRSLDLSSNRLHGTISLRAFPASLVILNLTNNNLDHVPQDLDRLPSLRKLNLSLNKIASLQGFDSVAEENYHLEVLELWGNNIRDVAEVKHLRPLQHCLRHLTLQRGGSASSPQNTARFSNPVCTHMHYAAIMVRTLSSLETLDGTTVREVARPTSPNAYSRAIEVSLLDDMDDDEDDDAELSHPMHSRRHIALPELLMDAKSPTASSEKLVTDTLHAIERLTSDPDLPLSPNFGIRPGMAATPPEPDVVGSSAAPPEEQNSATPHGPLRMPKIEQALAKYRKRTGSSVDGDDVQVQTGEANADIVSTLANELIAKILPLLPSAKPVASGDTDAPAESDDEATSSDNEQQRDSAPTRISLLEDQLFMLRNQLQQIQDGLADTEADVDEENTEAEHEPGIDTGVQTDPERLPVLVDVFVATEKAAVADADCMTRALETDSVGLQVPPIADRTFPYPRDVHVQTEEASVRSVGVQKDGDTAQPRPSERAPEAAITSRIEGLQQAAIDELQRTVNELLGEKSRWQSEYVTLKRKYGTLAVALDKRLKSEKSSAQELKLLASQFEGLKERYAELQQERSDLLSRVGRETELKHLLSSKDVEITKLQDEVNDARGNVKRLMDERASMVSSESAAKELAQVKDRLSQVSFALKKALDEKQKLRDNQQSMEKEFSRQRTADRTTLNAMKQHLKEAIESEAALKAEVQERRVRETALRQRVQDVEEQLKDGKSWKEQLQHLENAREAAVGEKAKALDTVAGLRGEVQALKVDLAAAQQERDQFQRSVVAQSEKIAASEQDGAYFRRQYEETQRDMRRVREKYEDTISAMQDTLDDLKDQVTSKMDLLAEYEVANEQLADQNGQLKSQLLEMKSVLHSKSGAVKSIEDEVMTLKRKYQDREEYYQARLKEAAAQHEQTAKRHAAELQQIQSQLAQVEKERADELQRRQGLDAELRRQSSRIAQYEKEHRTLISVLDKERYEHQIRLKRVKGVLQDQLSALD